MHNKLHPNISLNRQILYYYTLKCSQLHWLILLSTHQFQGYSALNCSSQNAIPNNNKHYIEINDTRVFLKVLITAISLLNLSLRNRHIQNTNKADREST